MAISGPRDGWKILKAFGIDEKRHIRKAAIYIEVDCCVTIVTEEYTGIVVDDALEMITETYEVHRKVDGPKPTP